MAQILLPYDGSDHSKKALDKALDMLDENDELIVLYVIPAALIKEFENIDPDISRAKAHEMVNKAIEIAVARGKSATGLVKEGDVSEVIINFASEIQASLIVIGSMGISKIGRFSLGSVAERVTRHSDRPVLIVR
ncbi:MAG: universal stress protein [Thermoplasmata archaeon]|nr:universal stress protein [Thermoplasmata archaeon]